MKIAHVVINLKVLAGGNRIIIEQANRLADKGHEVSIFSLTPLEGDPPFEVRVPVFSISQVEAIPFDAVIFNDIDFATEHYFGLFPAKKYFLFFQHDLELISEMVGMLDKVERCKKLFSQIPSRCKILSVSTWVQEMLLGKYGLKSVLVPNAIDHDLFKPTAPLVRYPDPTILLYDGFHNWKGFYEALLASDIVQKKIKGSRVLVFGAHWLSLPAESRRDRLEGSTWPMTHFVSPQQVDIPRIYSSADVFVSSSWVEGFGLPGLEAMACGTPVVTTASGGVSEYAIPDKTAIIVPPQNPQALAEGIVKVLRDQVLRKALIENGITKAKEFHWDRSIDVLENILS